MKRSLLLIGLLCLTLLTFGQSKKSSLTCTQPSQTTKSTASEWAQVVDFTSTDIDGVQHHLQSYLDAGKNVIVDLSATWCGPCWSLHQTGVFEDLYNNYGPAGTDELVVLWVEIDESTTLADIEGTGSNTQGDWTNGGDFPVPIINDGSISSSFSELYEGLVPTVFMVCPSGMYKDITDEAWTSASAVYSTISTCPDNNNDMEMTNVSTTSPATGCALGTEENVVVELTNIGLDAVTDVEVSYSINGGTLVTETAPGPVPATGTYTYTFTQTEDLSAIGTYEIEATVNWPEDTESANNTNTGVAISGDSELTVDLTLDNYPGETSWDIVDNTTGGIIAESPVYENGGSSHSQTFCILSSSCYTFTIYDEYGDGICCSYGDGSYTLTVDGTEIATGGDFNESESVSVDAQTPGLSDITFCTGETIDWDTSADGTFSLLPADIDNSTTGDHSVTYTINEGGTCEASETFTVSVVDNTLDITPEDITVCQGESINFPAGSGTFSPATVDNTIAATTTVTYTINEGLSCENSATFDVTVNPLPSIDIACENQEYCINDDITLPSGSGTFDPASIDNTAGGTTSVTYTTTTSADGCVNTCDFDVTVYDNTIDITAEDMTVCEGEAIDFPSGSGIYDPSTVDNSTAGTTTVTYYMAQGTDCENSLSFDVTVLEAPDATISQDGYELSTSASGDLQWYMNGDPIDGATESTYTCTEDGDYYVIATDTSGCTDQSNTITVSGTDVETHNLIDFSIYPNPAEGRIYIDVPENTVNLTIYDITGKAMLKKSDFSTGTIDISAFTSGVYLIEIEKDELTGIKKLLIK